MPSPPPLDSLLPDELARLEGLDFDAEMFGRLADNFRRQRMPPNEVQGVLEAPPPRLFRSPAPLGTMQGDALLDAGLQFLDGGRAGLALLNGGMATRFRGQVKAVVEALPGQSFLGLQARRLARLHRSATRATPLLLMNSFATEGPTREHLDENGFFGLEAEDVRTFRQSGLPRLKADGGLFRDAAGQISVYGPGHGDLLPSIRRSGTLEWAMERGVEVLLVANVDNLGAALDPQILGHFLASGAEMMCEVVERRPGEPGGSPCSVDGRVQLVEGFAFPEDFDQQQIPWFNTNTLWFRTEALDRPDSPLSWYVVRKQTGDGEVVQFERLVGQATWFLETCWLPVSRQRFLPVKSPQDLEAVQPALAEMFRPRLPIL